MPELTRRELLKRMTWGALATPVLLRTGAAFADPPPRAAIARHADPALLTRTAIEALGGMGRFVQSGQHVVIKPNIGWDRTPEQAANTHPEVVATLVTLALAAGAGKVSVMDHTCNDARRCYKRSGIEDAAKEAGANVVHLRKDRGQEMDVAGVKVKRWPVFREILEADVLINAPIAKHHGLSRATLGMKNWYGAIDGARNRLHQDVPQTCVDLAAYFKPALTVLDGTRALLRNGPQGGNLGDVAHPQVVMAGTDPVAIDAFGGTLLELTPADLPHLALAEAAGLGSADWQTPDIHQIDLGG